MSINVAIILAGGLGTRLRSLVDDRPKPMALVCGIPFLEYLIEYWSNEGIDDFILSVGYLENVIIDYFGYKFKNCSITYVKEKELLGTGGALLKCIEEKNLDKKFILLNGDSLFKVNLKNLEEYAFIKSSKFTISVFKHYNFDRYLPISMSENGKITYLKHMKSKSIDNQVFWVNGGVYLIDPAILKEFLYSRNIKYSLENEIIPGLLNTDSDIYGYKSDSYFIDIGIPEDYKKIQNDFLEIKKRKINES